MLDCSRCGKTPEKYIIAEDGRAYCPDCLAYVDYEQYQEYADEVKDNDEDAE